MQPRFKGSDCCHRNRVPRYGHPLLIILTVRIMPSRGMGVPPLPTSDLLLKLKSLQYTTPMLSSLAAVDGTASGG